MQINFFSFHKSRESPSPATRSWSAAADALIFKKATHVHSINLCTTKYLHCLIIFASIQPMTTSECDPIFFFKSEMNQPIHLFDIPNTCILSSFVLISCLFDLFSNEFCFKFFRFFQLVSFFSFFQFFSYFFIFSNLFFSFFSFYLFVFFFSPFFSYFSTFSTFSTFFPFISEGNWRAVWPKRNDTILDWQKTLTHLCKSWKIWICRNRKWLVSKCAPFP